MFSAEIYALAAAFCWSFGGLLSTGPVRALGAVPFNRVRLVLVFFMLSIMALITGGWHNLPLWSFTPLTASALVGVCVGDSCFYAALKRLGPRRAAVLFAVNAPLTAIMGFFLLDELLPARTAAGCALVTAGIFLAVVHGTHPGPSHSFEQVRGRLAVGVAMGFLSAFCQAVSLIIARPVLASGVDPIAASALRVGVATLVLIAAGIFRSRMLHGAAPLTPRLLGQTALSGLVGMALGMTLLLKALACGPAGVVSTLAATSPVLVLPVLWAATKECPAPGAWIGAALAVTGAGCIFNS